MFTGKNLAAHTFQKRLRFSSVEVIQRVKTPKFSDTARFKNNGSHLEKGWESDIRASSKLDQGDW